MSCIGSEQRIQTLFRELQASDKQWAPGFSGVWHRAESVSVPTRRPLGLIYAASFSLLLLVVLALVWNRQAQPEPTLPEQANVVLPLDSRTTLAFVREDPRPKLDSTARKKRFTANHRNARLLKHEAIINNALAIASWQSPTTTLMSSPVEDVLSSLPQLTEAAVELRSFLPSVATKEDQ